MNVIIGIFFFLSGLTFEHVLIDKPFFLRLQSFVRVIILLYYYIFRHKDYAHYQCDVAGFGPNAFS